jgi:ubiquinone/menaquinone biosynthesis C-methylase UbiE
MAEIDFIGDLHGRTARDYLGRVNEADKAACAEVAIRWGSDYWDGDQKYGFGGYRYDGRWRKVAERMAAHYGLCDGACILDVGCGKGFLLYEFTQILKNAAVTGLDISDYAIKNGKDEIKDRLEVGDAARLPFADRQFDLVISITTLHNLHIDGLFAALGEIERVGRGKSHVTVESYRTEREKANLLYWQLTCRAFHTPQEWEWIFAKAGYSGDHGFIFFE